MKPLIGAVIIFVLFIIRFQTVFQSSRNLDSYINKPITVKGKISSNILLQGSSQRFKIGRIEVRTDLYPAYHYGDELIVTGTLQRQVINRYISRFSLMYPGIAVVKSGNNIFIGLKERLELIYAQTLPEPEASLMSGIVLGSKRELPPAFYQALKQTGTLHLVVASGYNVSVVMGAIIFVFAGILPRTAAVFLGIAGVLVYSFMAGMEPAIIRAALMGTVAALGQVLGRPRDGLRLLAIAAGAMVLINPLYLLDIGFQLSFMATLGLIIICPRLPRQLPSGAREALSAQLTVWPILLYHFGSMSWFGILVNSLIGPLVPGVMLLAWLPGLAFVPLHLMVSIINWFY